MGGGPIARGSIVDEVGLGLAQIHQLLNAGDAKRGMHDQDIGQAGDECDRRQIT